MADLRSLLPKASSSKHDLRSIPNLELPRWQSPTRMAASIIPPPIVQSTYALPSRTTPPAIKIERSTTLKERQGELEADIQFLLDAQAEGLLHGLEGTPFDDQTSTGSTTPRAQSMRSVSAGRRRTHSRKKLGLRSARKGIYNCILALSTVKDEELQSIDLDIQDKEQVLEQIDEYQKKRQGLRDAAKRIDSNEETVRVQRLRQEANSMQEQISNMELQLADMKARRRKLMKQAAAVDNSVQAKLASYTSSLRQLEEDIQRFLSARSDIPSPTLGHRDNLKSIAQSTRKQKTLDVARNDCIEERENILQQRGDVEHEKAALDEGASLWKEVVQEVTVYERQLRAWTTNQISVSLHADAVSRPHPEEQKSHQLGELLGRMRGLTDFLEIKFEFVQTREWNLLVAAVGVEVDALKQGRQLLESIIPASIPSDLPGLMDAEDVTELAPQSDAVEETLESNGSIPPERWQPPRNQTGSEDDPDPELLFSRQETDSD